MPRTLNRILFYHKSFERLWEVKNAYDHYSKDEIREVIIGARYVYRTFLENVSNGTYLPEITDSERVVLVDEAYGKSDFDWTNKDQFSEFYRWAKIEHDKIFPPKTPRHNTP